MIIKTKQFTLRPFKLTDAADLARNINDWDIIKCLAMEIYPYGIKDAEIYLKKSLLNSKLGKPESLVMAIVIDNEVVGSIGCHKIKYGHKASIGYWLAKKYWGKGIMTRVVKVFCTYLFKKYKLKRIYAEVFTFNQGSRFVLENNGFKLEGVMKKGFMKNGKLIDEYLFAKVRK